MENNLTAKFFIASYGAMFKMEYITNSIEKGKRADELLLIKALDYFIHFDCTIVLSRDQRAA